LALPAADAVPFWPDRLAPPLVAGSRESGIVLRDFRQPM